MRVVIPIHGGRISPLFDAACRLLTIEILDGNVAERSELAVGGLESLSRVRLVVEYGVDVLICGAISRPLETMLSAAGVTVIARRCGPVEDVLRAYMADELDDEAFLMPGCRKRHRQGASEQRKGIGKR